MLESALVMLIFLPVLIGIMDFGQFLYFHQTLSDRVRAAARYGAVHPCADPNNCVEAINVAIYNDPAGSANGATAVLPNINDPSREAQDANKATVTATIADAGTDDARIRVTVSNYPYVFLILPSSLNRRTITDTEPYEIGR
jgi:Flp pilus assembly protein TadG